MGISGDLPGMHALINNACSTFASVDISVHALVSLFHKLGTLYISVFNEGYRKLDLLERAVETFGLVLSLDATCVPALRDRAMTSGMIAKIENTEDAWANANEV